LNCFNIIAGICSILGFLITIFKIIPKIKNISLQIQNNNILKFDIVGHSKIMIQKSLNKKYIISLKYILVKNLKYIMIMECFILDGDGLLEMQR
jgi:hypothetical protein